MRVGLSKKQRQLRRAGIGSSEIGILAGLSPYGSVLDVWASKVKGLDKEENEFMEWGQLLEEPIARVYCKKTGSVVRQVGTLQRLDKPFCLSTPDRAVVLDGKTGGPIDWNNVSRLVECKSTSIRQRRRASMRPEEADERLWGDPGTDQVPPDYLAQSTWQMGATPVRVCDLPVLFVEPREVLIYTVHYDAELDLGLQEIAERFYVDYVLTEKEPPPDSSDRYREMLTRLHPRERDRKTFLSAGDGLAAAALILRQVEALEKALHKRGERLRNLFRQAIGDETGIIGDFGTISWTKNRDGVKVDHRAYATALRQRLQMIGGVAESELAAKLLEQHTTPKEGARVLRKKWMKDLSAPAHELPELCAVEKQFQLQAGDVEDSEDGDEAED